MHPADVEEPRRRGRHANANGHRARMVVGPRPAETDHVTGIGVRHRSRSRANPCRLCTDLSTEPDGGRIDRPVRTRRYDEATDPQAHGLRPTWLERSPRPTHPERCAIGVRHRFPPRANRAASVPNDPQAGSEGSATSRVALTRALRRPRLVGRRDLDGDRSRGGARLRRRAGFHPEPADVEAHGAHAGARSSAFAHGAPKSASSRSSATPSTSSTSRRPTARSTRSRSRRCRRRSPPPRRSAPRASSSTSARISAPGWRGGLSAPFPPLREAARADGRPPLAAPRELRRRRRHDRVARSTSWRRSSTRSTGTRGSGSASTPATGGSRASTSPTPWRSTPRSHELDASIGLDRLRCLHVNDADAALGSNRDRHALARARAIGDGMATFLAHPAFQGLPAILETAGETGYAEELGCCALHRRGLRRKAAGPRQGALASHGNRRARGLIRAQSATVAKTRKLGRSRGTS